MKPCLIFLCLISSCLHLQAQTVSAVPPGYAIASAHPLATNAGLEIIAKGGNAFDAAVAVAAALAVVEPYASGLGGGGVFLLHQEAIHQNTVIDAREVAPQAASRDMFLSKEGQVIPGLSLNGGLAAAIPGEPAALVYLAKHYGRLPLQVSLAPAIRLAKEGFPVDKNFRFFSMTEDRTEQLRRYPASAAIFLNHGKPYQIGQRLIQTDLANTLTQIAQKGTEGFYSGIIAAQLVKGVNAAGGIWTISDLEHYQIKQRDPLIGAYHNMLVITVPPPFGGVGLLTMLNILAHYHLDEMSKLQWVHTVIEAMRLSFWQREIYLGDPDFVRIPLAHLLSAENAKGLSGLIPEKKALDSSALEGPMPDVKKHHTTHFSILDAEGNRVAATLSVNYYFGSSVVAAGTGVLLNDEMDDFTIKVGTRNVFRLVGSEKNAIAPGKRPLSNMAPSFLELPERVAILGTPGGSHIPTMILLASLLFHDSYGAITMASSMRFHHQYLPDIVEFEPDTFSAAIQKGLQAMGYHLQQMREYHGDMQVITWDKKDKLITAASDPRSIGLAASILSQ
jgi:gamma-glutamyltranspeptidase/glutathione hydrolase